MYDDAVSTSSVATSTTSTMSDATIHEAALGDGTPTNSAHEAHKTSAPTGTKNTSTHLSVDTASEVLFKVHGGANIEIDATGVIIIKAVNPVTIIANPSKSTTSAVDCNFEPAHTRSRATTTIGNGGLVPPGGTTNDLFEAWIHARADKVALDADALQSVLRTCRPDVDGTMQNAEATENNLRAAENDLRAANDALEAKTTELQFKDAELKATSDKLREIKEELDAANVKIAEYELEVLESRHQVTKAQLEEATATQKAAVDVFRMKREMLKTEVKGALHGQPWDLPKEFQPYRWECYRQYDRQLSAERNHQESQKHLDAAKLKLQAVQVNLSETADELGDIVEEKQPCESPVTRPNNVDKISITFNFADDHVTVETTKTATFGDLIERLRVESDEDGGYRIPLTEMRFNYALYWFPHTATAQDHNLRNGASVFVYRRSGTDMIRRVEWV